MSCIACFCLDLIDTTTSCVCTQASGKLASAKLSRCSLRFRGVWASKTGYSLLTADDGAVLSISGCSLQGNTLGRRGRSSNSVRLVKAIKGSKLVMIKCSVTCAGPAETTAGLTVKLRSRALVYGTSLTVPGIGVFVEGRGSQLTATKVSVQLVKEQEAAIGFVVGDGATISLNDSSVRGAYKAIEVMTAGSC